MLTAEDDVVISTCWASEGAGTIILGIAVRLWALLLEEHRIIRGRAGVEVGACAAVLRLIESSTSTFASIGYFQLWRADGIYVAVACYFFAIGVGGSYGERDIESINERDIKEVQIVVLIESIFKKCCRNASVALTFQQPAAVTSVAPASPARVEGAASTTPDSRLFCSCGNVKRPRLALSQCLTATRTCSGPNCVWTLVLHYECCAFGNLQINMNG